MKSVFTIFLFLVCLTLAAQEDVYKKIAQETCDCIAKKNFDYKKVSKAEIQMSLGLCMMESAQRNKLTMDVSNTEQMTELGQKIGMQMAPICPQIFQAFTQEADELIGEEEETDNTEYFTSSGKVKLVEEKDFFYITLKESTGKESRFIWLYYFNGSDAFKDDPKKLIGKEVTITYILLEVLEPKSKVYYNLNVISGLELK